MRYPRLDSFHAPRIRGRTRKVYHQSQLQEGFEIVLCQIKYEFNYYQKSQEDIEKLRIKMNDPKFRPHPLGVVNVNSRKCYFHVFITF
jgi:predicted transcriptional regulator